MEYCKNFLKRTNWGKLQYAKIQLYTTDWPLFLLLFFRKSGQSMGGAVEKRRICVRFFKFSDLIFGKKNSQKSHFWANLLLITVKTIVNRRLKITKFAPTDQVNIKNKLKGNRIFFFTKIYSKRLYFAKNFPKRTVCGIPL